MRAVTGLDGAKDVNARQIGAGKCSVVHDLSYVRSRGCEHTGEMSKAARAVADQDIEAVDATVGRKTTFDHPAMRQGIDVAAGEEQDDSATCQVSQTPAHERGQSSRTGSFDDAL